jgi:hypothetical protein
MRKLGELLVMQYLEGGSMSNAPRRDFVTACLSGEAFEDEIDDWVDAWHDHDGAPNGSAVPLRDYLGMNKAEYSLWVEQPRSLRFIITAHRRGIDVNALLSSKSELALAARSSSDQDELAKVVRWLVDSGQMTPDN